MEGPSDSTLFAIGQACVDGRQHTQPRVDDSTTHSSDSSLFGSCVSAAPATTGEVEEKHLADPPRVPGDQLPHLYARAVTPAGELTVKIDGEAVFEGSLFDDGAFDPPFVPPAEMFADASHAETLRAGLQRLWKEGQLCDLTLTALHTSGAEAGARAKAHRTIQNHRRGGAGALGPGSLHPYPF